jgi:hypothetical protein
MQKNKNFFKGQKSNTDKGLKLAEIKILKKGLQFASKFCTISRYSG